jgi:hypothetical protein
MRDSQTWISETARHTWETRPLRAPWPMEENRCQGEVVISRTLASKASRAMPGESPGVSLGEPHLEPVGRQEALGVLEKSPGARWASPRFCRKVRFLGQNPKIGYQEFNELQTPKLSKKQLCDRTASRAPGPGQAVCRLGSGDQPYRDTEADHGRNVGAEGGSTRLDAALVLQPSLHHAAATAWLRRSSSLRRPKGHLTTLPYPVPPVQHLCKARSCAPTHACATLHLAAGCRGGTQRVTRARRVASLLTGDAGGDAEGR